MKAKPIVDRRSQRCTIVATLAGNTVINIDAPCRGVSALNTSCLNRVEFGNWHDDASIVRWWI
jgi:hypothetical protein